jgi:hypothetical protein
MNVGGGTVQDKIAGSRDPKRQTWSVAFTRVLYWAFADSHSMEIFNRRSLA